MSQILDSRLKSYRNSNAVLTKNNKILLPHADDADYNSDSCYQDYLIDYVKDNGLSELAESAEQTSDNLIKDMLSHVDPRWAKKLVLDHMMKERL